MKYALGIAVVLTGFGCGTSGSAYHGSNPSESTAIQTSYTLTVDNTLSWCNVAVNIPGATADTQATDTFPNIAPSTVVQLSVTPKSGFIWPGTWSGTDNDATTAATNTITMNGNKTVTVCCPFPNGTGCSTAAAATTPSGPSSSTGTTGGTGSGYNGGYGY